MADPERRSASESLRAGAFVAMAALLAPLAALGAPMIVTAFALGGGVLLIAGALGRTQGGAPTPAAGSGWRALPLPLVAFPMALALWAGLSAAWALAPGRALAGAAVLVLLSAGGLVWWHAAGVVRIAARPLALALGGGAALTAILLVVDHAEPGYAITPWLFSFKTGQPWLGEVKSLFGRGAILLAILVWPLAVALRRARGGWAAAGAWALVGAVLAFADSMAAKFAFVAGTIAWAAVRAWPEAGWRMIRVGLVTAIVGAPLAVALLPGPAATGEVAWLPASAHHRLAIWRFTTERIAERPILGFGMDASRAIPGGRQTVEIPIRDAGGNAGFHRGEVMPLHPHNAALQWWLELGAVGALLAAGFVWWATGRIARAAPGTPGPAEHAGALAAAAAVALVSFGIWQGWWLAALWLAAALGRAAHAARAGAQARSAAPSTSP